MTSSLRSCEPPVCHSEVGKSHEAWFRPTQQMNQIKSKSNLHYTRRITPKRVTSCRAHLRGLAPGLHSSEETSQRWRVVGDTVSIWPARESNPRPPAPIACASTQLAFAVSPLRLSVIQRSYKYQFLRHWFNSALNRTQVYRSRSRRSIHSAIWAVIIFLGLLFCHLQSESSSASVQMTL